MRALGRPVIDLTVIYLAIRNNYVESEGAVTRDNVQALFGIITTQEGGIGESGGG